SAALNIVDALLAQDPRLAELVRLKIAILARRKDFDALDRLDDELGGHPWAKEDAAQLVTIGAAFLAIDHPVAARRWLERSSKLDPQNTAALILQARIAYAERQYDLAEVQCQTVEQAGTAPQRLEARMILGRVAHLRGNTVQATVHYERV